MDRSRNTRRSPDRGARFGSVAAILLALVLFGLPARAQVTVVSSDPPLRPVRGVLVDAGSGAPIEGAYILAQATESLARTDADGHFRLLLPEGPQRLVITRVGYGEFEVVVDPEEDERVRIEASPVPVELEGVEVEARSFQTRLDSINATLSRRSTALWASRTRGATPGTPRVAPIEKLRKYDDVDDPAFAIRALGVQPDLMDMDFCAFRTFGQTIQPTFIIDGEVQDFRGCDRFREMDVRHICRMDAYPAFRSRFADIRTRPSYDLHIWTCSFMARLAAGQAEIPEIFEILEPIWDGIGN